MATYIDEPWETLGQRAKVWNNISLSLSLSLSLQLAVGGRAVGGSRGRWAAGGGWWTKNYVVDCLVFLDYVRKYSV